MHGISTITGASDLKANTKYMHTGKRVQLVNFISVELVQPILNVTNEKDAYQIFL